MVRGGNDALDAAIQVFDGRLFGQEHVRSSPEHSVSVVRSGIDRESDDPDARILSLDLRRRFDAIEAGHVDVHHDDSRLKLLNHGQSFLAVRRFPNDLNIVVSFQDRPQSLAHHGMIVHEYHRERLRK